MKRTIIVFDMLYLLAFDQGTDHDKILTGLAKAKAKPILSPLQALTDYSGIEQVVSVDPFFDFMSYENTETIGKHNWLNMTLGTVVWAYPWDIMADKAIADWSMDEDVRDGGKVRCIRKSYPSQDLLNSSNVFLEFNKYAFDRLPSPSKNFLRSNGLIPLGAEKLLAEEIDIEYKHLKKFGTETFNPYSYFSKV